MALALYRSSASVVPTSVRSIQRAGSSRYSTRLLPRDSGGAQRMGGQLNQQLFEAQADSADVLDFGEILREAAFRRQKLAFEGLPQAELARYNAQFVITKDGQILDHDPDLVTLTMRFFSTHPKDEQVYIAKVGGTLEIRVTTPFFI